MDARYKNIYDKYINYLEQKINILKSHYTGVEMIEAMYSLKRIADNLKEEYLNSFSMIIPGIEALFDGYKVWYKLVEIKDFYIAIKVIVDNVDTGVYVYLTPSGTISCYADGTSNKELLEYLLRCNIKVKPIYLNI